MEEITSFAQVVKALGGSANISAHLGANEITVRQWRTRNSIPAEYWAEIVELAAKRHHPEITEALLTRLASRETRAAS